MLRIPCPKCHKISYTSDVESFRLCPYCGSVFSGKYGPERRRGERVKQEIPFSFFYQGKNLKASTVDISEKGLGIKIYDDPPIAIGDILNPPVGDLSIAAKVMWIKKLPDIAFAGLQRLRF